VCADRTGPDDADCVNEERSVREENRLGGGEQAMAPCALPEAVR
jgi:hypothetical protein